MLVPLTVYDFFCGAGGMGLGFKQAGFEIVGAWDINKFAIKSYRENIGEYAQVKDIREMTWLDLVPWAIVWTFGFPCQDLSIANTEGKGLEGERSGLFFEVMRLLDEVTEHTPLARPYVLLAENVLGLKPYLPVLEQEYKKRGYVMKYTILDSQNFGVPQHRERYFVVGIREDLNHNLFTFPPNDGHNEMKIGDILQPEEEVDPKYYLSDKAIEYMNRTRKGKPRWEYHKNEVDGVAATLTANMWKGVPYGVIQGLPRYRRFTPREVARLQGFPDSYKQVISDTQFYQAMGNAVTVTVAKALAQEIKWFLQLL